MLQVVYVVEEVLFLLLLIMEMIVMEVMGIIVMRDKSHVQEVVMMGLERHMKILSRYVLMVQIMIVMEILTVLILDVMD